MTVILSKDNARVKEARKLLQKKYRDATGSYLIEGFHLLTEAVKSDADLLAVFVESGKEQKLPSELSEVLEVTPEVLKSLSDEQTPQGVVAVVRKSERSIEWKGRLLVLESVQDPGNVGTMIRTADAAGFAGVLRLGETADLYSPKVLRAAQGSTFHLPIVKESHGLAVLKESGLPIFVSTLSKDAVDYRDVRADEFALVVGNEAAGVSSETLALADKKLHIPMPGQAESLNVAVAAGVLMFGLLN